MSKFFWRFQQRNVKGGSVKYVLNFLFFFFSHALCVRCLNMSPNEIICWLAFPSAAKIKGKKKNKHSSERNFVFRQKL